MMHRPKPVVLIILDGWGYSEDPQHNAIYAAQKPNWDQLWQENPHTILACSGLAVGLPPGQMGNSEVGHMNIGAGRVIYQDFTRITQAIKQGDFFSNSVFLQAIEIAKTKDKAFHILGLLSPGGVHSHESHLFALVQLAAQKGLKKVYLHAFLDGRDTPPKSALDSLEQADALFQSLKCGQITSIVGRYYAMDRDKRWDRTETACRLLVEGQTNETAKTAQDALKKAYAQDETDEFVRPRSIPLPNGKIACVEDGDVVLFMNFRADRARQLAHAITTAQPKLSFFATLTQVAKNFTFPYAFAPVPIQNGLGEYLATLGLKQLRIAETEKYAHVTFFFNGGIEKPYPEEDRILVPSPLISTYDLKPEMSAYLVTEQLVSAIRKRTYDFMICNFANPDMVGHTGNYPATIKAIEAIDLCLGQIIKSLTEQGGELVITADHGNAERLYNVKTEQPHTAHTCEPVPFIYRGRKASIRSDYTGSLPDVAPTLLEILGLNKPSEMTGRSLVVFNR